METAADLVFLSRLQFALTTSFHILFPVLSLTFSGYFGRIREEGRGET